MSKTTTWPHQDLIAEHNLNVAELPAAIKNKIDKFNKETDEDLKESLDETIYGLLDDVVEKKKKEEKATRVAAERAERKTKNSGGGKDDVSAAATAAKKQEEEDAAAKKKSEEGKKPFYRKLGGW